MKLHGESLLVRADAGTRLGGGHLMRCLALAQAWQGKGGRAFFLSHCESEMWVRLLQEAGVGCIPLDTPHPDPADLQRTLAVSREIRASWLVLDGYHLPPAFQEAVRRAGYPLLVIDDSAHWPAYHADILLNQNLHAGALRYACDPDTLPLLGTRYALLRPEFQAWAGWSRDISQSPRKVLVTLGGGDPDNVTLKAMGALTRLENPALDVTVVVGAANPHLESLRRAAHGRGAAIRILQNALNMPDLMAQAEVAISAGGSTCWELAFMGLPNLILVLAENQAPIAASLHEAGAAVNVGWCMAVDEAEISRRLRALITDHPARVSMSRRGRELVDGRGPARVMSALLGHGLPVDVSESVRG